jgi:transcriptional regulator of arginine metabolism
MKRQRQNAILKAVRTGKVKSQAELVDLLARQGFEASQTTVSRDLRELGVTRGRSSDGTLRYGDASSLSHGEDRNAALRRVAPVAMLSVEATANLVVVKTSPGNAQGLAWAIDNASLGGIAGTVAGDDTIFVACSKGTDGAKVGRMLMKYALDKR